MNSMKLPNYRLAVDLESQESIVPYDYRDKLLGVLYSMLESISPDTGKKLHDEGYRERCGRYYKYYTHNLLPNAAAYHPKGMVSLDNKWVYNFGSADADILSLLEKAFLHLNSVTVGDVTFHIRDVKQVPLKKYGGIFYCLAPITVKNKERYLIPDDPEFNDAVVKALLNRYKSWTGKDGVASFRFLRPRRRLELFGSGRILGFSGKLELYAPPEVVRFAQLVGLGQKTSIGMGMIG